jgi:hypothetical protein
LIAWLKGLGIIDNGYGTLIHLSPRLKNEYP